MKRKFKLENLDCAHCAAKMEDGIKKIEGVQEATINFMMQKLVIEAEEQDFEQIMDKVQSVCKKIEPDCKIVGV